MGHSVLVAHSTRRGSTRRIGEVVAATLAARGLDVDVQPAGAVESLERYDAVVLGGPVRLGHWHRDTRRFLHRHRRALARLPVAVFVTGQHGPPGTDGELAEALADTPELEPIAAARFAGGAAEAGLRLPGQPRNGHDPEQVRRFAEDVARELGV